MTTVSSVSVVVIVLVILVVVCLVIVVVYAMARNRRKGEFDPNDRNVQNALYFDNGLVMRNRAYEVEESQYAEIVDGQVA